MEKPILTHKRFVEWKGVSEEIPWNYEESERLRNQESDRVVSLRKGIEDVLDLHGEDFIKGRLRQLLRVV